MFLEKPIESNYTKDVKHNFFGISDGKESTVTENLTQKLSIYHGD